MFIVPPGPAGLPIDVVLVVNGVLAKADSVTVPSYARLVFYSLPPSAGPTEGGISLTIAGASFVGTAGTSVVTIGGQPCPVLVSSTKDSAIVCTLPAGVGALLPVQLTINGFGVTVPSSATFSYAAPVVQSITPTVRLTTGNTSLTISGDCFGTSTSLVTVRISSSSSCTVTSVTSKSLCTLQVGQGAGLGVSVTVDKQSTSFVSAYSYAPPNITAIAPYLLNSAGGTVVTLIGSNVGIGSNYSVLFNGAVVTKTTYVNSSFVTFTAPAGSGLVPVHMVVAG